MTYSEQTARLWMAMNIGPLWIARDEDDPLSPQAIARDEAKIQTLKEPEQVRNETQSEASPVKKMESFVAQPPLSRAIPKAEPVTSEQTVSFNPADREKIATANWSQLQEMVSRCQACKILCQSRLSTVFGTAEPTAKLVIVGEAPGRDEDLQGKPFVGKSGELLENILHALGLVRGKDVAIINVLKCRPPNNRDPMEDEIAACRAYLDRQLQLIDPKVVILSGRIAAHTLLNTMESMGRLRQKTHSMTINGRNVPVIVTYHPSYLLRSPTEKAAAWRDFMSAKHQLLGT